MSYTNQMTEIVDWAAIKSALYSGADEYLNNAKVRNASGLWHGDTGRNRAENLKSLCNPSNPLTHDKIFILLSAIFNNNFFGTSNSLARCIAEKIFLGEYKNLVIVFPGVDSEGNVDTLSCTVFSLAFFNEVRKSSYAQSSTSNGECAATFYFHHLDAMKGAVKTLISRHVTDAAFKIERDLMIKSLESKPNTQEVAMHPILPK